MLIESTVCVRLPLGPRTTCEMDGKAMSLSVVLPNRYTCTTLTAHVARLLVAAVAAAVPTGAHDRRRPAAAVAASKRTVVVAGHRTAAAAVAATAAKPTNPTLPVASAEESLHWPRNGRRAADQRRLVAAVATRDNRVAELVLGQAFAALAAERVRRTPARVGG